MTLKTWLSKVPCIHWILSPKAQSFIRFTLRPASFEIHVRNVQNDLETDLEHLAVNSTPYTLNAHLRGPTFGVFCCTTNRFFFFFSDLKCIDWPHTDLEHLTDCQKYPVYNKYLPQKPKVHSVTSAMVPFRDNCSFWFPLCSSGEREFPGEKILKFGKSKFQTSGTVLLWGPLGIKKKSKDWNNFKAIWAREQ